MEQVSIKIYSRKFYSIEILLYVRIFTVNNLLEFQLPSFSSVYFHLQLPGI